MLNWFTEKADLFHLQVILLVILAFTLPLSVEIQLSSDHKMFMPSEPVMILFVILVVISILQKRIRLSELITKEILIVAPFVIALIFSTAFSTMKLVSLKYTAVNLLYIISFFICLKFMIDRAPWLFKKLITLFTASFLLVCCLGVYRYAQYDWNPVTIKGVFVPFYKDHTIFGASAALLTGYWLFVPVRQTKIYRTVLHRGLSLILAGAVLFSYSRAAIISLIVMGIVYLIFLSRVRLWQFLIILAFLSFILLLNNQFVLTILNRNSFDSGNKESDMVEHTLSSGNITTDVSNLERLNRWNAGIQMFENKPVTGFGPGTYQFEYIPFQRPEMMTRLSVTDAFHIPENSGGTAHSEYILAASEMGIPGIIAWLILVGGTTLMLLRLPIAHPGRSMAMAVLAALSSYYFHAIFNNFLNTDKFAFLFWGLMACFCLNMTAEKHNEKRFL